MPAAESINRGRIGDRARATGVTPLRTSSQKFSPGTLASHTGKPQGAYQRSESITYHQVTEATEYSDPSY